MEKNRSKIIRIEQGRKYIDKKNKKAEKNISDNKTKQIKKKNKFNIITVIFIVMIIYCFIISYMNFNRKKVINYEVNKGNIVSEKNFSGVILRNEVVKNAKAPGNIHYFSRSGRHVRVGEKICIIDKSGGLESLQENNKVSASISEDGKESFKKDLSYFSANFDISEFYTIYDKKYEMDLNLQRAYNSDNAAIDDYIEKNGDKFARELSDQSGVLSFNIDGLEGMDYTKIGKGIFDVDSYKPKIIDNGSLVEQDAPIYKIIQDEEWYIVFPLTDNKRDIFINSKTNEEKTKLKVVFKDKDIECDAQFKSFVGVDGKDYGMLTLDKFMIAFCNDRYINFEIGIDDVSGLKIPKKSVVKKSFIEIPKEYVTKGGGGIDNGVTKQSINSAGVEEVRFIPIDIIEENVNNPDDPSDDIYYAQASDSTIENNILSVGDVIISQANNRFTISNTKEVEGVYNTNKGYALFKRIEVIDENNDFYIVKDDSSYGIRVYDHILGNVEGFKENDFLYN